MMASPMPLARPSIRRQRSLPLPHAAGLATRNATCQHLRYREAFISAAFYEPRASIYTTASPSFHPLDRDIISLAFHAIDRDGVMTFMLFDYIAIIRYIIAGFAIPPHSFARDGHCRFNYLFTPAGFYFSPTTILLFDFGGLFHMPRRRIAFRHES